MTLLSRILSLFPIMHLFGFLCPLGIGLTTSNEIKRIPFFLIALFFLYLFPLLCFRIHNSFFPLTEGVFNLSERKYSSWWGGHQIQGLFIAVPVFEGVLRLVPGLYSLWLRCWGSKIGKRIYWTPRVEILDRSLLEIGDHVIFGHLSALCCHAVVPKNTLVRLIVRKIKIGHGSLIGAESRIGAGSVVSDNEIIPFSKVLSLYGKKHKGPDH